jgi:hypothetical protein
VPVLDIVTPEGRRVAENVGDGVPVAPTVKSSGLPGFEEKTVVPTICGATGAGAIAIVTFVWAAPACRSNELIATSTAQDATGNSAMRACAPQQGARETRSTECARRTTEHAWRIGKKVQRGGSRLKRLKWVR